MTDLREPATIIEAAQTAAGTGDYPEAERLLRQAAAIQEATLGESHPDVAITLNNLAFVCERTGRFDDAERGYRRAHKIAVASLSPGHPFIKTSLSNLMEFCEARGIPIWTRPETPVEDEPLPDDVDVEPSSDDVDIEPAAIEVAPDIIRQEAAARRVPLRMAGAAALVIAVIVVIVFTRQGQGTSDESGPVAHASTATVPPPPAAPARPEIPDPVPPRAPEPTVVPSPRPAPVNANAHVTVLKAQLCSAFAKRGSPDWQCTSAGSDVPPGRYTFYTRLLSTSATTVEHRWYFSGRVHQTMRLRVSASPGSGYRTFSATTVNPERAGEWKVELRAADGSLLDEARFLVR